jgi:hypothetical protein
MAEKKKPAAKNKTLKKKKISKPAKASVYENKIAAK